MSGRWVALDLLRFCAVFLMVQGHTFTELLDPAYQAERWWRHHNFVHGYTAPMFLFASGLAFGYTTFRAWHPNTKWGPVVRKRFRRYGLLLVLGYALHLPSIWPSELMSLSEARLQAWAQVDVLHHIGVSLALCQLLVLALKSQRAFARAVLVMLVVVVALAPVIWALPVDAYLPMALAGFVDESAGSLFPIFPWAGFTYAGILSAYYARNAELPSRQLAWPFAVVASVILLVPIAINHLGINPYGPHDFWRTSPYYFFWRLGNVLAVLALLCFLERWLDRGQYGADPRSPAARALTWVRAVGQESLVVYVAHLLVLHGSVLNHGVRSLTGRSLSLASATVFALGLFVAMVWLANVWSGLKRREARPPRRAGSRMTVASES